jgi:hypothetical protein
VQMCHDRSLRAERSEVREQTAGTGVCRVPSLTHTTDNAPPLAGAIVQRGPLDETVTEITDRRRPPGLTTPRSHRVLPCLEDRTLTDIAPAWVSIWRPCATVFATTGPRARSRAAGVTLA